MIDWHIGTPFGCSHWFERTRLATTQNSPPCLALFKTCNSWEKKIDISSLIPFLAKHVKKLTNFFYFSLGLLTAFLMFHRCLSPTLPGKRLASTLGASGVPLVAHSLTNS